MKQRLTIIAGLAALAIPSWYYTARGAWEMTHMDQAPHMFMPHSGPWTAGEFWTLFLMWTVMMAAMMLPSIAPLTLALTSPRSCTPGRACSEAGLFVGGYVTAWTLFSAAATAVQWALHQYAILSPMMISRNYVFGGAVLLAAGVFQLTPWKHLCLGHCRGSMEMVRTQFEPVLRNPFRVGLEHGVCCMGCCWAVMALLFVTGVMDLFWVIAIAALVLGERLLPGGPWLARVAGVAFVVWGLYVLRPLVS